MTETTLDLAESFPGNTREAWEALLVAGKDASPESVADALDKITKTTLDGIHVKPLYDRGSHDQHGEDGAGTEPGIDSGVFPQAARRGNPRSEPWDIRQIFRNPDPALSNQEILQELERGSTSIHLVLQQASVPASSPGIALQSSDDLTTLLQSVYLELITTAIEPAAKIHDAIDWFFQLTQERKIKTDEVRLACNVDPFASAALAATANSKFRVNSEHADNIDAMVALAKRCATDFPAVTSVAADTRQWHNLGANTVQELAIACAAGVHHLKAMLAGGMTLEQAQQQMVFHLAVDADFFSGIAKLRAMRELWTHICQQFANNEKSHLTAEIHAHTSQRMLSRLDADNNQLRNTLACSAAAIGGANCISVEAHHSTQQHDYPLQQPDEFSRRIARNIQLVLQEESNLHRVVDPLGGSPFIESLTSDLVVAAWNEFQNIEKSGGIADVISTGALAESIAKTQGAREEQVATRKSPLVGVSEFASPDEKKFAAIADPSLQASPNPSLIRASQPYESLRIASWQFEKTQGQIPTVLLLNLGDAKDYRGRTGFSRNFLAAGGLTSIEFASQNLQPAADDDEVQRLREALQAGRTNVVVVCSSDTVYADLAADFFHALRTAGASHIVVAGRSQSLADSSLCDDEIYLGCHSLAKLQAIHRNLGIEPQPEPLPEHSTGDAS